MINESIVAFVVAARSSSVLLPRQRVAWSMAFLGCCSREHPGATLTETYGPAPERLPAERIAVGNAPEPPFTWTMPSSPYRLRDRPATRVVCRYAGTALKQNGRRLLCG